MGPRVRIHRPPALQRRVCLPPQAALVRGEPRQRECDHCSAASTGRRRETADPYGSELVVNLETAKALGLRFRTRCSCAPTRSSNSSLCRACALWRREAISVTLERDSRVRLVGNVA